MIKTHGLHKSFGAKTVLHGASFAVEPGTITALVGPNGSGKTTTLHLLVGLVTPDAGTAHVGGVDVVRERAAAQAKLAFLRRERGERTERGDGVSSGTKVISGPRGADPNSDPKSDRIEAALQRVDLAAAHQPCGTLSGGMRQRLGLALLALADVDVLLLDEPGLSLDPDWRRFLMQWLRDGADTGATVLMATHLLEAWTPVIDRVLTCADGLIRAEEASANPVGVME